MASRFDDDRYLYRVIRLPAFPKFPLTVAFEFVAERLWFPVKATCAGLRLNYTTQIGKLQAPKGDFRQYLAQIPIPTLTRGKQESTCIEWEGFGMWLASIQDERTTPDVAKYLRLYKRQVWKAANSILMREPAELAAKSGVELLPEAAGQLPSPARGGELTSLVREHEDRLVHLEDMLALVTDDISPAGAATSIHTTCPHCGGPLRIDAGALRVVADDD